MKLIITLAAVFALAGCATTHNTAEPAPKEVTVGMTQQQVRDMMGQPIGTSKNGKLSYDTFKVGSSLDSRNAIACGLATVAAGPVGLLFCRPSDVTMTVTYSDGVVTKVQ